jgi:hypothetical protein
MTFDGRLAMSYVEMLHRGSTSYADLPTVLGAPLGEGPAMTETGHEERSRR